MSDRDGTPDETPPPVLNYQSPATPQSMKWVGVRKVRDTVEANLIVSKLQQHGIHARVDMEHTGALGYPYAALVNTKVQVLAGDEAAARALLLEIEQQRVRRQEAASMRCPRCDAPHASRTIHPLRWLGLAVFALFFVGMAFGDAVSRVMPPAWLVLLWPVGFALLIWGVTPRWRCKSCGHRWSAPEPEELQDDGDDGDGGHDVDDAHDGEDDARDVDDERHDHRSS